MDYRQFLERYSQELLLDPDLSPPVPESARDSSWLGFEPSTDDDIQAAESRLGVTLPPSLRDFYLVTNGWRNVDTFLHEILPVESIDYLRTLDPELCTIVSRDIRPLDDPEWVEEQTNSVVRSICIGLEGDATRVLIDPESDVGDGEWNVGVWASWHPGMHWSGACFAQFLQLRLDGYIALRNGGE